MSTQPPGTLQKMPDGYAVTFEREFPYDAHTVWEAITRPSLLALWFMEVRMEPATGARMEILFPDQSLTYGRITRFAPERLFEYIWENSDGPGELVTWELAPAGPSGCRLVMTHGRLADEYAVSASVGWHVMLDQLEAVLQGRKTPFSEAEGDASGKALEDAYARQFRALMP